MGFIGTLFGVLGFSIGVPIGLLLGFLLFIYYQPANVKDPIVRPLCELDTKSVRDLLPEIPLWVKNPDYDRVDWMNMFVADMWPYLDKGVCVTIRRLSEPIFSEYIGKFQIRSIEFEKLSLGTLPPLIQGVKIHETNENELIMEPVIKFAGNPNIVIALKLLNLRITLQLTDLQIFLEPRIILKPLVPAFPCFANAVVSLVNKPHVDFGMKLMGGDVMAIPGVYRFVQETIKRQIADLYLWPESLQIPILDSSIAAVKKPVGILHVNVIRAVKLLRKDFLGTSDPYVKLRLSGDRLAAKKTTVKRRNLNPEWNESFKLSVRDEGCQVVPLKQLVANETREMTLELMKNMDANDAQNEKRRGKLVVELTFVPFREDAERSSVPVDGVSRRPSSADRYPAGEEEQQRSLSGVSRGAGLLMVMVHGAENVEGHHRHTNPHALIFFRGERRKTKSVRRTRDPIWNEEFQYMLEEPPLDDKIRIEVQSKHSRFGFPSKETLGHVDINLTDVLRNGRINQKYNLINSKNGKIHVEMRWKMV